MTKMLAILAFAAASLSAGAVLADDDDCYVPMTEWQPRSAVVQLAETKGWAVQRIKVHDGCYTLKGLDPDGREIEVKLNPATLEVLELEYEGDGHHRRNRDRDRRIED